MRKVLLLSVLSFTLASCGGTPENVTLTITDGDGETVNMLVELAQTTEDRARGLMNREELGENEGMLFIFPDLAVQNFWMKDTEIPLDIMFFDGAGKFINAHTMEPCAEEPCTNYKSAEPAQFALETNAGFRAASGIGVGWMLDMKKVEKFADPE